MTLATQHFNRFSSTKGSHRNELKFGIRISSFNIVVCLFLFICLFAKNLSGSAEVEEARGKLKVSSKFVQDVADYVRLVTMIMIIIYIML